MDDGITRSLSVAHMAPRYGAQKMTERAMTPQMEHLLDQHSVMTTSTHFPPQLFRIGVRGRGGERWESVSELRGVSHCHPQVLRTVREGSSAPLPRLRMTSAFLL